MANLTDKILKRFDEGLLTGLILTDLQKAFDTINHEVILQKLKAVRFSEQSIQRFRCYLCDQIFLAENERNLILEDYLWSSSWFYPETSSIFDLCQ